MTTKNTPPQNDEPVAALGDPPFTEEETTKTKFNHSIKVPIQYRTAARLLRVNFEKGASLKSLIFQEKHAWTGSLFGLISRIAKHKPDLDRVIAQSNVAELEPRLDKYMCLVLMTELLFGAGKLIGCSKPVECVRRYEPQFRELLRGNPNLVEAPVDGETVKKRPVKENPKPRYVRVNTNAISRADAIEQFTRDGYVEVSTVDCPTYDAYLEIVRKLDAMEYVSDIHVKNLFVFSPRSSRFWAFHDLVKESRVILQDKASCLPAMLLDPPRGATILDMCAAPGMKSSHLASILKNKGTVYAIEKDQTRYQRLCNLMRQSKSNSVHPLNDDSLALRNDTVPGVQYILVDPSCSGSGMTSRLFGTDDRNLAERLVSLSGYQTKILQHAMREFPQAQRIVYSTCSVYEEENEQVVHRSLEACPEWELIKPIEFAEKWKSFGSPKWKHVGKKCIYARSDVDLTDGFFVAMFQRRPEEGVDNYHRAAIAAPIAVDEEEEEKIAPISNGYSNPFGSTNGSNGAVHEVEEEIATTSNGYYSNPFGSRNDSNKEHSNVDPNVSVLEVPVSIPPPEEIKKKKKKRSIDPVVEIPDEEPIVEKSKKKKKNIEEPQIPPIETVPQEEVNDKKIKKKKKQSLEEGPIETVSQEVNEKKIKKKKKHSLEEEPVLVEQPTIPASTETTDEACKPEKKKKKSRSVEEEASPIVDLDAEATTASKKAKKKKHRTSDSDDPQPSDIQTKSEPEMCSKTEKKNKKRSLEEDSVPAEIDDATSVKKSKKHKSTKV